MNLRKTLLFFLIPLWVLAGTPHPTPAVHSTPGIKFTAHREPTGNKRKAPRPAASARTLRGRENQTPVLGPAFYDRLNDYLSQNDSAGKGPSIPGDQLLGVLGAVASGLCAGVAAVQWLDLQGKDGNNKNLKPKSP